MSSSELCHFQQKKLRDKLISLDPGSREIIGGWKEGAVGVRRYGRGTGLKGGCNIPSRGMRLEGKA